MATILEMPRYGATMEEGSIGKWLVREGEAVTAGEAICSIEIEKLSNDVAAPVGGILRKIILPEGASAPCGAPIGIIAAADEDISALVPDEAVPAGVELRGSRSLARVSAAPGAGWPSTPESPKPAPAAAPPGKPGISPKAAQLAKELGLDWQRIAGTGRLGMITRADVRSAAAQGHAGSGSRSSVEPGIPVASVSGLFSGRLPVSHAQAGSALKGVRNIIAQRMMESLQRTAQAVIWMDADVTELMSKYREVKKEWERIGVRLSLTAPILRALSLALKANPVCRTRIAADGSLLVIQKIDIAVAVDAPGGLFVPVLRDIDKKSLRQVAVELTDLSERARLGTLTPDEMSGHTMTVSNLGSYGVTYMHAVLNLPETVLLGVGACELRPVYRNGGLFPREILPLSLTFDHRIVDGGPAAAFLRDLCRALSPSLLEHVRNDQP